MLIAHELAGVRVLVAHEDTFQREYLSEVMTAAGAIVNDYPMHSDGGDVSVGNPPADAAVVSQKMWAADIVRSLFDAAAQGAVKVLVVHPASAQPTQMAGALRSLATPYAGFQVVDALSDMLGRRHHGCSPL